MGRYQGTWPGKFQAPYQVGGRGILLRQSSEIVDTQYMPSMPSQPTQYEVYSVRPINYLIGWWHKDRYAMDAIPGPHASGEHGALPRAGIRYATAQQEHCECSLRWRIVILINLLSLSLFCFCIDTHIHTHTHTHTHMYTYKHAYKHTKKNIPT
jgi:hypothetical protein